MFNQPPPRFFYAGRAIKKGEVRMYHHSENHKEVNGEFEGGHIEALLRRHGELESRLATFKTSPISAENEIKEMKRQKLHIMDQIRRATS
jgi:hypothetical protein